MKFTLLIWAASLLTAASSQKIVTTGAGSYNSVHTRYEIRDLVNNHPKWWALFIQAMTQWQNMNPDLPDSYFQIAAIHGVPRADWNGFTRCNGCTADADGYATHDSILFSSWHRAYLALFEQELCKQVLSVANNKYGGNGAWVDAAKTFRLPFWDWAATPRENNNHVPHVLKDDWLDIQGPSGKTTVRNPLKMYRIPDSYLSRMAYTDFTSWKYTARQPQTHAGNDDEGAFEYWFSIYGPPLKTQLYNLLTYCHSWTDIASDVNDDNEACKDSIEGIHNNVHGLAGGTNNRNDPKHLVQGHMQILSVSSFDPLFWIHHANVDRIYALWQTLNGPDKSSSPLQDAVRGGATSQHDTWTYQYGKWQYEDTLLDPFRRLNSRGVYDSDRWTTSSTADWRVFGYTYPEWTFTGGKKSDIAAAVNNLYGSNSNVQLKRGATNVIPGFSSLTHYNNGSQVQYTANIEYPRHALNGSYRIWVFDGEPRDEDPQNWVSDPNAVNVIHALGMPGMIRTDIMASAPVSLTEHLTNKHSQGHLPDLHISSVSSYLAKNLAWRIQTLNGTLNPEQLPGFQIGVLSSSLSPVFNPSILPTWSEAVPLPNITHGKCGGASPSSSIFKHVRHKLEDLL